MPNSINMDELKARPKQLVPHAMDSLREKLTCVQDELFRLEEELNPVLTPTDTDVADQDAPGSGIGQMAAPLSRQLDDLVSVVTLLELKIQNICSRVEV